MYLFSTTNFKTCANIKIRIFRLLNYVKSRYNCHSTVYLSYMKLLIPSLALAMFFTSCNYKKIDSPAPAVNTVEAGEKFYIPLPEDHRTGYMWQLSNEYDTKTLDYLSSVFHGNEKGVYFNFAGIKPGKTTLNFTLMKYHDTTEVKSYVIEVK